MYIETTTPVFNPLRVPEVLTVLTLYSPAEGLDHAEGMLLYR
jgi:hypothetical protein